MTDMGVSFDDKKATQGMAEGNPEVLSNVHDPGREGTKVSRRGGCALLCTLTLKYCCTCLPP
jgi:hypothetical protein